MKKLYTILILLSSLLVFSGCSKEGAMDMVNELSLNTKDIKGLDLDFDNEDIKILESSNSEITIKEYMNINNKKYYLKQSSKNNVLSLSEGKRPFGGNFDSYIELYIPKNIDNSIYIHSTSGDISLLEKLSLTGSLKVDSTNGTINISNLESKSFSIGNTNGKFIGENIISETVDVKSTGGEIVFNNLAGKVDYKGKSGDLEINNFKGYGSFDSSGDGSINITLDDIQGDIIGYCKNGDLNISVNNKFGFEFIGKTKEGSINSDFKEISIIESESKGKVGEDIKGEISLETKNGKINLSKGF